MSKEGRGNRDTWFYQRQPRGPGVVSDDMFVDLGRLNGDGEDDEPELSGWEESYALAGPLWFAVDWWALPLLDGSKGVTPSGFSGYEGVPPTAEDIAGWVRDFGDRGVCLRFRPDMVGIDFDDYESPKHAAGVASAALVGRPPLPLTWRVTSRFGDDYDGVSGVRVFRLPEEYAARAKQKVWAGQVAGCPAIELLRFGHRQMNCWPTMHKRGTQYGAMNEATGEIVYGPLPKPETMPLLPEEWCELLLIPSARKGYVAPATNGHHKPQEAPSAPAEGAEAAEEAGSWVGTASRFWTPGMPCPETSRRLAQYFESLLQHRHDTARRALMSLAYAGRDGHRGVRRAAGTLQGAFVAAATSKAGDDRARSVAMALAEWERLVAGLDEAVEAQAAGAPKTETPCCPEMEEMVEGAGGILIPQSLARRELEKTSAQQKAREQIKLAERPEAGVQEGDYLTGAELDELPPVEPLIEGVLPRDSYAVISGRDGTFKSFVSVDWAMHVAAGQPWLGRPVKQMPVLYSVGEGLAGMKVRKQAWEDRWGAKIPEDMIVFRRRPVNLFLGGDDFLDLVQRAGPYGLAFFDTLQRHVSGADTSGDDMGVVVDHLKILQRAMLDGRGTTVCVAHTGKTDKDSRGFSGIEDDADTVWHARRKDREMHVVLNNEKQKDGAESSAIQVQLVPRLKSLVVEPMTLAAAAGADLTRTEAAEARFLFIMRDLFSSTGALISEVMKESGLVQSTAYRVRNRLVKQGQLVLKGTRIWLAEGDSHE